MNDKAGLTYSEVAMRQYKKMAQKDKRDFVERFVIHNYKAKHTATNNIVDALDVWQAIEEAFDEA